jgi:cytochrome c biogenesis protein CcmG/thiol:disulfide interchange protein DsbE
MNEQVAPAELPQGSRNWSNGVRIAVLLGVMALIALLTYGLLSTGTSDRIDTALRDGRSAPAPGFTLELLERGDIPPRLAPAFDRALRGDRLSLEGLRGTPVVLNLWASWCTPCRDEAESLQRSWSVAGRRGVLFLGLDIQDLRGDARAFIDEFGLTYPSVREPERSVARSYGATGFPETFFIDRSGRVVGHVIGAISPKQIVAGVVAAQSGRVGGVASGGDTLSR